MVRNPRSAALHEAVSLVMKNLEVGVARAGYVFRSEAGLFKASLQLERRATLWAIVAMKNNNRLDFIRM